MKEFAEHPLIPNMISIVT